MSDPATHDVWKGSTRIEALIAVSLEALFSQGIKRFTREAVPVKANDDAYTLF